VTLSLLFSVLAPIVKVLVCTAFDRLTK